MKEPEPCKLCLVKAACRNKLETIRCDEIYMWMMDTDAYEATEIMREFFTNEVLAIALTRSVEITVELMKRIDKKRQQFNTIANEIEEREKHVREKRNPMSLVSLVRHL